MSEDFRPPWAVTLEAERTARGWGKWDMARQLYAAVGITNPTTAQVKSLARQITRWESGRHFPANWADAYGTAFGIEPDVLFPPQPMTKKSQGVPIGRVDRSPSADGGDDAVKRRALFELVTALGAGAALPTEALSTILSGLDEALAERADVDISHWQDSTWEYSRVIWVEPTGALVADLATDILALGRALRKETRWLARQELLRSSAEITAYMAQELSDMGHIRGARRCFQTAIRVADESQDRGLATWVRAYHAARAAWEGRDPAAVGRLLDDALESAGSTPSVGLATTLQTRAEVLADQGDADGAEKALAELRRVHIALPDQITVDHISPRGWPEDYLRFSESFVYSVLGDSVRAKASIDHALRLLPPERSGTRVNLRLMHALSLVHERETSDALESAVENMRSLPNSTARRRIGNEIIKALPDERARALPAARELRTLVAGV
ncbi:hypothetical protein AGRA3207_000531 [Actinomadura graeca]|uniref:XRE family transcriptional regulator n=1 Tax=Actinomadura graeca TaxID=2750812 RepID=A0ABX8QN28_9ACTN|nr:hypothetical protein [Actinomadura graeca]QXJ19920.1 hypothetical protein AGRA3207_000531 [Actinomadura graeca]